jgi:magnesium transporter/zinc transporter
MSCSKAEVETSAAASDLRDEINAILTLKTNDRLYMPTIITALILPATFVTDFFRMNKKQLFFSEDDNGTIYAALLCCAALSAPCC